jgi:hypothetical protein
VVSSRFCGQATVEKFIVPLNEFVAVTQSKRANRIARLDHTTMVMVLACLDVPLIR